MTNKEELITTIAEKSLNRHLYVKQVDSIIDKALSAGAKLIQPVENQFYGDRRYRRKSIRP